QWRQFFREFGLTPPVWDLIVAALLASQELRDQSHQLIDGQREDTEHQMAENLGVAAHPHIAPPAIILEAAIDSLGSPALIVAHVLGKRVAGLAPAPRLGCDRFLATRHVARMRVDDRHVTVMSPPSLADIQHRAIDGRKTPL